MRNPALYLLSSLLSHWQILVHPASPSQPRASTPAIPGETPDVALKQHRSYCWGQKNQGERLYDVARYYGAPRLCVGAFILHPHPPPPSSAGCHGAVVGARVTPREQSRGCELFIHGRCDSKDGDGPRDPPVSTQVLCSEHAKSLPILRGCDRRNALSPTGTAGGRKSSPLLVCRSAQAEGFLLVMSLVCTSRKVMSLNGCHRAAAKLPCRAGSR